MTIAFVSRELRAYFNLFSVRQFCPRLKHARRKDMTYRFRMKTISGMQSRSLCGPGDGRGAYAPESLSSNQCEGALRRF